MGVPRALRQSRAHQRRRAVLGRASRSRSSASRPTYQVPPEYLVAILGVETRYGRITGHYRVLDALATLAFDYPPRQQLLQRRARRSSCCWRRRTKLDPLTTTGSYAGAMGAPQFMPSAYRRYAVAANNDKRRDLWGDWDDILASVANYLHENGWNAGAPVLAETSLDPDRDLPDRAAQSRARTRRSTRLGAHGVTVDRWRCPPDTPAVLILRRAARWSGLPRGLPQLLRDHALQRQRSLRHGGARSRAGDRAAGAGGAPRPRRREHLAALLRARTQRAIALAAAAPRSAPARTPPRPAAPAPRRRRPPAPAAAARPTSAQFPMRCRASSRAAPTAIRPSTTCSGSATTCSRSPTATSSAAWPPGTARRSMAATPRAASPTTCTA